MSVYFKKLAGEWVVYGPDDEIQLGEISVHKRNGNTTTATVERLGKLVRMHGDVVRLGHLAPRGEEKTYRERREAKAENLRGWAEKRQEAAVAALNSQPELRHDWAFITQPGRIPARDRMNAADERAFKSMNKAEEMAERADNIEAAARGAIYSDDADAIERLEAKIADLEAQRDRIKAYNASCRKGQRDVTLLDERQQEQLVSTAKCAAYQIRDNGAAPAYWAQNIGGNITRNRQRLERLKREKALLS
jgi:Domain of unknown function (DUF3560)